MKHRVLCYFEHDDRVFVYYINDRMLQEAVESRPDVSRIYFTVSDEDFEEYVYNEELLAGDNLKEDFVWFIPGLNKLHQVRCTCGKFLEASHSMDRLAKLAVKHHRRTGHSLNPRGN